MKPNGTFRTPGLWLALGLAWVPGSLPAAAPAKPNVLFIITDQQFADVMSCRMGKQYLHTPAMDGSGRARDAVHPRLQLQPALHAVA